MLDSNSQKEVISENTLHPAGKKDSSRRFFLAKLGLGSTLLALAVQAYAFMRSLVPNVLYEEPKRFKVGLVWAGSPTNTNDRNRSCSLAALASLGNVAQVTTLDLSK